MDVQKWERGPAPLWSWIGYGFCDYTAMSGVEPDATTQVVLEEADEEEEKEEEETNAQVQTSTGTL